MCAVVQKYHEMSIIIIHIFSTHLFAQLENVNYGTTTAPCMSLSEKCPNTDQRKLRIWTYFTQLPCMRANEIKTKTKPITSLTTHCPVASYFSLTLTTSQKHVLIIVDLPYLPHWKHFKNDEKYFLFHLKSSFRSQDNWLFVMTFWSCRKNGLIRKQFMTSQPG